MGMLCLGRKPGESIEIQVDGKTEIKITVIRNERGQLVFGIDSDREKYKVIRTELLDKAATQRSR